VRSQIDEYVDDARHCTCCGQLRKLHDRRARTLQTGTTRWKRLVCTTSPYAITRDNNPSGVLFLTEPFQGSSVVAYQPVDKVGGRHRDGNKRILRGAILNLSFASVAVFESLLLVDASPLTFSTGCYGRAELHTHVVPPSRSLCDYLIVVVPDKGL